MDSTPARDVEHADAKRTTNVYERVQVRSRALGEKQRQEYQKGAREIWVLRIVRCITGANTWRSRVSKPFLAVGIKPRRREAIRRLKDGFARTSGQLGPMIAIEQETWEGDTLRFRMRALGQTAAGSIEVLEEALRIEVTLPWLLAQAAKRLLPILRKEATLMLEKK